MLSNIPHFHVSIDITKQPPNLLHNSLSLTTMLSDKWAGSLRLTAKLSNEYFSFEAVPRFGPIRALLIWRVTLSFVYAKAGFIPVCVRARAVLLGEEDSGR